MTPVAALDLQRRGGPARHRQAQRRRTEYLPACVIDQIREDHWIRSENCNSAVLNEPPRRGWIPRAHHSNRGAAMHAWEKHRHKMERARQRTWVQDDVIAMESHPLGDAGSGQGYSTVRKDNAFGSAGGSCRK